MAYELVEEILDHAPAGLTPAERLILVCIAEEARKGTRTAEIPAERLRRRTGLGDNGLRPALRRLESRGISVRLPLGKDRNGKPVYAIPGRVCAYSVPVFDAPIGCPCHRCEKAVPQHLLQTEEVPEHRQAVPQHRQAVPQHHAGGATAPPNQSGDPVGVSPDHASPPSRAPSGRDDIEAAKQWAREKAIEAQAKHRREGNRRDGSAMNRLNQALLRIVPVPPEAEGAPA